MLFRVGIYFFELQYKEENHLIHRENDLRTRLNEGSEIQNKNR